MSDPFNQIPTDPDWCALADKLCDEAAARLGCMVVLVAVQPKGKMGICRSGVPTEGAFAEMAADMPKMLRLLAHVTEAMDAADKDKPRQ